MHDSNKPHGCPSDSNKPHSSLIWLAHFPNKPNLLNKATGCYIPQSRVALLVMHFGILGGNRTFFANCKIFFEFFKTFFEFDLNEFLNFSKNLCYSAAGHCKTWFYWFKSQKVGI